MPDSQQSAEQILASSNPDLPRPEHQEGGPHRLQEVTCRRQASVPPNWRILLAGRASSQPLGVHLESLPPVLAHLPRPLDHEPLPASSSSTPFSLCSLAFNRAAVTGFDLVFSITLSRHSSLWASCVECFPAIDSQPLQPGVQPSPFCAGPRSFCFT